MHKYSKARIAALNDRARRTFEGCRVVVTQGVLALEPDDFAYILEQVRSYRDFNSANNTYGEHDFGKVSTWEFEVFWKFDYIDVDYTMHSLNPADEAVTARVLTIMLAEEF